MTSPARARAAAPRRQPAPRARPRHLRVVETAAARRRRRVRAAVVTAVALTLLSIFGLVAFNVFLVQSQFRLERVEQQADLERQEYERLRLEAARLSSPERILDIARQELGMVDPASITLLTVAGEGRPGDRPGEGTRAWTELKPLLASEP